MVHSTIFIILVSAMNGSRAAKAAALAAATAHLLSLSLHDTGNQLMYQDEAGYGVLHLLAWWFSACEQAASFLSLVIERGRESCGTTDLMSLTTNANRRTPLHCFAYSCSDLSLTKMVLREHPPSLVALNNGGWTPLGFAKLNHGSTSEFAVFFRTTTTAYNTSNLVTLEALCGSSPYLSREIRRQTIALRAAVAICLNRQEATPSGLSSVEAGVALSLLERVRDFGRVGNSSDVLRRVLEYVGPQAN